MTTFFTSDLHIGHVNIMKYCPQRLQYLDVPDDTNIPAMNNAIVRIWNEQVSPDDTVFVLGDVAMGKVADTIQYVHQLVGHKFLVMGNHDRPHDIMTGRNPEKQAEWREIYESVGFTILDDVEHLLIGSVEVTVCHFPYEGDHTDEERYGGYRPVNEGLPLVHGHVHDLWQTRGNQYNVGIDAWSGVFRTEQDIESYFRGIGYGD